MLGFYRVSFEVAAWSVPPQHLCVPQQHAGGAGHVAITNTRPCLLSSAHSPSCFWD